MACLPTYKGIRYNSVEEMLSSTQLGIQLTELYKEYNSLPNEGPGGFAEYIVDVPLPNITTRVKEDKSYEDKEVNYTDVKSGIKELFESNPELADAIYEALSFDKEPNLQNTWINYVIKKDNISKEEVLQRLETYKPKMITVYRGEGSTVNLENSNLPDHIKKSKGRWFTKDRKVAQQYAEMQKGNLYALQIPETLFNNISKELNLENTNGVEAILPQELVNEKVKLSYEITSQQKQQAQQLYSQYLNTIFPNSKVKDIVYHDTSHSKAIKNYKEYLQGKYDKKIDYINKETFGDPNYIEVFFKDGTSEILDEKESFNFIPFETFDKNLIGNIDGSISGKGFYFYTNPKERYDRSRFFTLNTLINIKNTANKSDLNLKDLFKEPNKSTDLLKKQGYDSVIGKLSTIGTEYIVFEPEQIHILGSKQDIEGFKKFVGSENIQYKKDTSTGIEIVEPKKSLALGQGSTTELDLAIQSYMLDNPNATVEEITEHLAIKGLINLDCSGSGITKAKDGLTNSVSGTGWNIVKDFKGKPKHSQGGYDITIKDDGFYMGDVKAENGLLIINN